MSSTASLTTRSAKSTPAPLAMVKIAPDKSLPQTKNRGQRLTLTLGALETDRGHGRSSSGGCFLNDGEPSCGSVHDGRASPILAPPHIGGAFFLPWLQLTQINAPIGGHELRE